MVKLSGVSERLYGQAQLYTVFVPNNDAFGEVPSQELTRILNDEDEFQSIIMCHIVPEKYMLDDLRKRSSIKALSGLELDVTLSTDLSINDARITNSDISLSDGIIHIIDQIIRLPDLVAPI
ncbi:MAG: fasciclin domain-containing protein [Promethearchaeia archaeon]